MRVTGKVEPSGIEVEAPAEFIMPEAAFTMAPIEVGSVPFLRAAQYKVPPVASPATSLAFTRVTKRVMVVLVVLTTNMSDTVGMTAITVGAEVGLLVGDTAIDKVNGSTKRKSDRVVAREVDDWNSASRVPSSTACFR